MNTEKWYIILGCILLAYAYAAFVDLKKKSLWKPTKYLAITVCLIIAVAATWLGTMQNLIGGPMIGLFFGMLIANLLPNMRKDFLEGTTFAAKKYLNLGIIFVGATLNYSAVLAAAKALPLLVFNICLSFTAAFLVGTKVLKLSSPVCILVGGGTSICGGSAIATLASIIKAKEKEIAYAMTAIFLFDMLAAISYPYFSDWIGLNAGQFGYLAGAAVNDTSSVVAAQSTYMVLHPELGEFSLGITVKLVRTTLLLVLAAIFTVTAICHEAALEGNKEKVGATIIRIFPWFILGFLFMALLNTLRTFDHIPGAVSLFKNGNKFLMTTALAGVGFKLRLKELLSRGWRSIVLGGCTWFAVFASSLIFVIVFEAYIQ